MTWSQSHVTQVHTSAKFCTVTHWNLHCSLCSYPGDVDIDAVVKEPITAGVKGLKVGTSYAFIIVLISIYVCWQPPPPLKTALNPSAHRNAEGHFRATYWWCTAGGRHHLFFHSPPCKCLWVFYHLIVISQFVQSLTRNPPFQNLEINWTGATNLLDSPAFRLVSPHKHLALSY